jgi:acyl carrier protein
MDINEFISHVADQFEETDASVLKPSTKFRELEEWSSMMALSLIAMTDDVYNIKLRGDDIRNSVTFEDIFHIIQSKS